MPRSYPAISRLLAVIGLASLSLLWPTTALADEASKHAENLTYFENVVNTGLDNGFSESNQLEVNDMHYGWKLGRFVVSGYTRAIDNGGGSYTFLKNSGDEISLDFILDQQINCLNGDQDLTVADDANGYDQPFGVEKQDFGHAALHIRQTNYQNQSRVITYNDYLSGKEVGATSNVDLFGEGDYEVRLDYELEFPGFIPPIPAHANYCITFDFSVRNGNSMVFLFDVGTGEDLTSSAFTDNGFRIDMANSKYLDVNVKREVLNGTGDGLVEDTRFNKPASAGDEYTDEGVYTVTVTNRYTNQETVKKVYVGSDTALKAYVAGGKDADLAEIQEAVDSGAEVNEDGALVAPSGQNAIGEPGDPSPALPAYAAIVAASVLIAVAVLWLRRKRVRSNNRSLPGSERQSTHYPGSNPLDDREGKAD